MDRIIREPECRELTALSRTSRWDMERRGLFPKRRRLSANAVGWLESEIRAWIFARETTRADAPNRERSPRTKAREGAPTQRRNR